MQCTFICHSAQQVQIQVEATYEGAQIEAYVPGAVYEFVSSDGSFTVTARVPLAQGQALEFTPGQNVTATFAAA